MLSSRFTARPLMICLLILLGNAACPRTIVAAEHTDDPLPLIKQRVQDEEAVLVDVREQKEWDRGHIRGAIFLPMSELSKRSGQTDFATWLAEKLPADKPLYIHCASGGRCLIVGELLDKRGYETRPLKPGYKQLVEAGFERAND